MIWKVITWPIGRNWDVDDILFSTYELNEAQSAVKKLKALGLNAIFSDAEF